LLTCKILPIQEGNIPLISQALAVQTVNSLYERSPPAHRHYVRAKLRFDPLTDELFALCREAGPWGVLVDAGCGRGQFSVLMAQWGGVQSVWGFDHDLTKVRVASEATSAIEGGAFRYVQGDLREAPIPPSVDTVLLLDVLHYLSLEDQGKILRRFSQVLRPGGRLVIRETGHGLGKGARFAAFFERWGRRLGFNRGEELAFRHSGELEEELRALGLTVSRNAPRGALKNVLLVAQRPKLRPQ